MSAQVEEELETSSLFPYSTRHKDDPRNMLERIRRYVLSFKYGRGDEGTGRSYEQIVEDLAAQSWVAPTFDGAPVIVPVPPAEPPRARRGDPREPGWDLAQALARRVAGARAARLWERVASVGWVEDQAPPSLADHLASLRRTGDALPGPDETVALVVDLITRGTELLACAVALRAAGHRGRIAAFAVAQATGKYPQPLQLRSFLLSTITGSAAQPYPTRHDEDLWFEQESEYLSDGH